MSPSTFPSIMNKVTICSAQKAAKRKAESYIPVKMNDERLDVTRYGGYTSIAVSGYTLLEYKVGEKTVKSLEALPVYLCMSETLSDEQIIGYFSKRLQLENKKEVSDFKIIRRMIPSGSLVKYNGFYYYLGGKSENSIYLRSAVQLCLPDEYMYYVKK